MDKTLTPPVLSVIIPCYNAGKYLLEAIESITAYKGNYAYEIIIINDGSIDEITIELLDELMKKGEQIIIHQQNKGPAAARNAGIKICAGKYILFLDSDNKIRPNYIDVGIEAMEQNKEVGIVYGNPAFFGDTKEPRFRTENFDICKILAKNYIDMCTVIRKQVWTDLEGFDENRLILGHEDWDFWIRADKAGWKFYYSNQVLFDYRILNSSLVSNANAPEKHSKMLQYLYSKHYQLYNRYYHILVGIRNQYEIERQKPFQSLVKYASQKILNRLRFHN